MKELKNRNFFESIRSEIACSLLVSFTFFFFGPLEVFLSSPSEFWFSISDVIGLVLISTFLCFIALLGIQYICSLFGNRVLKMCSSVIAAFGFAFYIQGNWTFIDYGKMDGTPINWSLYSQWAKANTLIWALIVALIILFFNIKVHFQVISTYIMLGIVGLELLTLGILYVSSIGTMPTKSYTMEGGHEFELSSDKNNIIVICADGFDGSAFLPVLEEEPDLKQHFDGFTFYEDTCGTSFYSEESAITLLTGNQLEVGLSFEENVKKAYLNTNLYDVLEQYNYDTYLYLISKKMFSPVVADQVVNYSSAKEKINNSDTFKEIYKMVAFRYMPHIIKKYFWYSSTDFLKLKGDKSSLYYNYDIYDLIQEQGVIAKETERNIYQFYWIHGSHEPANNDRYCHKVDKVILLDDKAYPTSQFEQTIGVVRMYTELICALKEAGIYDNTTIIFTADHGWNIRPNPCLLIKPANSRGELVVSDVPVSMIEDYLPTLEYFISGKKEFGDTIYELRSGMDRERIFYKYSINTTDFDRTYDSRTDQYYQAGVFSADIKLGKELLPDEIEFFAESGFSVSEYTHIWTEGSEAILNFDVNEELERYKLNLNYGTYNGLQPVKIYANNVFVTEFEANGQEEKSIIVPGECVKDGKLRLQFQFTNAVSPAEVDPNNKDSRKLALAFYSLSLSDTSK